MTLSNMKGKKWIIGLVAGVVAAAAVLAGGITAVGWYFLSPSGYVSLDVNPSIEIATNRLDWVVSVKAVNQEGEELLKGYKLDNRDLDDVIEDLVDRMILFGYLGDNQDNEILITSDDDSVSQKALEQVNTKVAQYLDERQVQAHLLSQTLDIDTTLQQEAEENHVSAGKMALIEQMLSGDSSLTAEEMADMRVSDLLAYAQENGISLKLLEDQLDWLHDQTGTHQYEVLEEGLDDYQDQLEDQAKAQAAQNASNNTSTAQSSTNKADTTSSTTTSDTGVVGKMLAGELPSSQVYDITLEDLLAYAEKQGITVKELERQVERLEERTDLECYEWIENVLDNYLDRLEDQAKAQAAQKAATASPSTSTGTALVAEMLAGELPSSQVYDITLEDLLAYAEKQGITVKELERQVERLEERTDLECYEWIEDLLDDYLDRYYD